MDTKKGFSVRQATLQDEPQILQCLAQAFAPYRDSYTPEGFGDTVLTPVFFRHGPLRILQRDLNANRPLPGAPKKMRTKYG